MLISTYLAWLYISWPPCYGGFPESTLKCCLFPTEKGTIATSFTKECENKPNLEKTKILFKVNLEKIKILFKPNIEKTKIMFKVNLEKTKILFKVNLEKSDAK
jgi:predicted transcriptional regulator